MGYEIIADDHGAIVYNNTDNRPRTRRLVHPKHSRAEHRHREYAEEVIELALERTLGSPSPEEWDQAVEDVHKEML